MQQRGYPGDHAALARIQRGGDFLLRHARHGGVDEVYAWQQHPPRAIGTSTMPERADGQAASEALRSGYDLELRIKRLS